MTCYGVALSSLIARLISFFDLWPTTTDQDVVFHDISIVRFFIGPLPESLILISVIELLRWRKFKTSVQISGSTLLICALHAIAVPLWGLLVLPGFLVDTATYVYWRRVSLWAGAYMIYIVHLGLNLLPLLRP
jgi:hypothetical protein